MKLNGWFGYVLLGVATLFLYQNCSTKMTEQMAINNQDEIESNSVAEPSDEDFLAEISILDVNTNKEIQTSNLLPSISLIAKEGSNFLAKVQLREMNRLEDFSCKWTFSRPDAADQSGDCKEFVDNPVEFVSPILAGIYRVTFGLDGHVINRSLIFESETPSLTTAPPATTELPLFNNSNSSISTVNDNSYTANYTIAPKDMRWETQDGGTKIGYFSLQGMVYTGYIGGPGWIPESWVTLEPGESVRFKVLLPPGLSIGNLGGEMPTVIGTLCGVYDQDLPLAQLDQSKLILRNYRVNVEIKSSNTENLQQAQWKYVICYQRPSDMIYPHSWGNFDVQFLIKDTALFDNWYSKNH